MTKVAIIGAGNFGFALCAHLDRKADPDVDLWLYDRKQENVAYMTQTRNHPRFFPTVELSTAVTITDDLAAVMADLDVLVMATVSTATAAVLEQVKPLITRPIAVMSIMKALDTTTGRPLSEIMDQVLAGTPVTLAVLAGGTTGEALTREEYLGATLACADESWCQKLIAIFQGPNLRLQPSDDVIGVQYAGSLKNCLSVIVGLLAGLDFGYGTQTHALSLGAAECEALAVGLGARRETFDFASQCWGNDMVMSATDPHTRNHQLGLLLGEGLSFQAAVEQMARDGKTAESANTLRVLPQIADLSAYPLLEFLTLLARGQVQGHEIVKIIETHA